MPLSFPLALIRRLIKGSELTYAEVDGNLTALETALQTAYNESVKTTDVTPLTPITLPLLGSDETVVFRGGVGYRAPLSALGIANSAPAAFTAPQWSATPIAGGIRFDITALPADGGSAITALQYRLSSGDAPVNFTGTGTGTRDITGLAATSRDTQVRAVNAIGAGPWSDVKTVTPGAAGGGTLAIVQAPNQTAVVAVNNAQQALTAVGTGNALAVVVYSPTSAGAPTITDSAAGTWGAPVHSYAGANGNTFRFYTRANISGNPTWVRATFAGDFNGYIAAVEVSGAGTSLVADATGGAAQGTAATWDFPFTSTVANTLFMGACALTNGSAPTGVAPVTASGSDGDFQTYGRGIFPTAGSNTAQITFAASRNGDKGWVALRPGP